MDINSVVLVGRLVRDVEQRFSGQTSIVSGAIAVSGGNREKPKTNFIDFANFGKLGDALKGYLVKGKQVAITGRLNQETWEKDGQKHSKISVIVDNFQLLGSSGKKSISELEAEAKAELEAETEEIPF